MPQRVPIPIAGQTRVHRSLQVNAQRSINLIPLVEGEGAKASLTLRGTPGLSLIGAASTGPCRSHFHDFKGKAHWVTGGQLYSLSVGDDFTALGSLLTQSSWVEIAVGRTHLLIVDGTAGYTWDGATFARISSPGFPSRPTSCGYVNGYFLVNSADTDRWQVSASDDPTTWAALEFNTADAHPDDAVAVRNTFRDAYLIGTMTTQVYYPTTNIDFPFQMYPQGVIEWGTIAPASVDKSKGSLFMLGQSQDGTIAPVMLSGFSVRPLGHADHWAELGTLRGLNDAEGFVYAQDGQTFYHLTLPTEDRTFVFHVEQNMVHERKSFGMGRQRGRGHGYHNSRHLLGDYRNGNVYTLEPTKYTENGETIERLRHTGILHAGGRLITVHELEVDFQAGDALISGQGSDPQAMLRYSVDGGRTWSAPLFAPMGVMGDYAARCYWDQLGTFAEFLFVVSVSDPIPVTIIDAHALISVSDL